MDFVSSVLLGGWKPGSTPIEHTNDEHVGRRVGDRRFRSRGDCRLATTPKEPTEAVVQGNHSLHRRHWSVRSTGSASRQTTWPLLNVPWRTFVGLVLFFLRGFFGCQSHCCCIGLIISVFSHIRAAVFIYICALSSRQLGRCRDRGDERDLFHVPSDECCCCRSSCCRDKFNNICLHHICQHKG